MYVVSVYRRTHIMLFYFCQFPHLPQEQLTMQIQNVIRNMISRQIQQQQWEQRSQVLILACLCHSFNIGPYGKMIFLYFILILEIG